MKKLFSQDKLHAGYFAFMSAIFSLIFFTERDQLMILADIPSPYIIGAGVFSGLMAIILAMPDNPKEGFSFLSLWKLVVYYGLFLIPTLLFSPLHLVQKFVGKVRLCRRLL